MVLIFTNKSSNIIMKSDTDSLPLNEEHIMNKSVELSNDNDPCIIHNTFCMKKLYPEITEYFDSVCKTGINRILWDEIPIKILGLIDINDINKDIFCVQVS